jgi:peptidyl-prolyl cis-trans isomerase C
MSRALLKAPILGLFVFLTACTGAERRAGSMIVVSVNEHKLTAREFAQFLGRRLRGLDALTAKDPNNVTRIKEEIVSNFILQSLIKDYAKAENIVVEPVEVEREVNQIRSSYPDDFTFRKVLAEEGVSLVDWKQEISQNLLANKVMEKISSSMTKPTDAELSGYYNDHKDRFRRTERVFLRQIVVDELPKAETLKAELKKRDFAELAKKFSVSPEAKAGGLVGWVEKGSVDIFDKAFSLPIGVASSILESPYGFHIFKVERKAAAGYAGFDEVRGQVSSMVRAQKQQALFTAWLDQQIRKSNVKKDLVLIGSIFIETRGKK